MLHTYTNSKFCQDSELEDLAETVAKNAARIKESDEQILNLNLQLSTGKFLITGIELNYYKKCVYFIRYISCKIEVKVKHKSKELYFL